MDSVFEAYLGHEGMLAGVASAAVGEPDDIPKTNSTVWILGKSYNALEELECIRRDVQSRLWCTYRRGFVPLGEPQLTTDKGWGCMLRCGQMVLAQALIDLHLGRDWSWTLETRDITYLKIVNRFEDARKSFFSIHQIALMGDSEDKKVGQWFGPNTVAQVLKKLVRYDDWCSLLIHVAMDNTIVIDDILSLCLENPKNDETWNPLLLIIPLRLGITDINPIYIPALKRCFELVGSCGMIGGRPNQALYFIGYVENEVLYLDPHTTQRSGSVGQKTSNDEMYFDETFHNKYAGRLSFEQMDPSLAVCFICKTRISFDVLIDKLSTEVLTASTQPLFVISKTRSREWVSSMPGMLESQFYNSFINYETTTTSAAVNLKCSTAKLEPTMSSKITTTTTTPTLNPKTTTHTSSGTFSHEFCNKRSTSLCDSEDFEDVNHMHSSSDNCSNGIDIECLDAGSDDDFEIIS